ncbi:envelope stress response membrane protein PspB [Aliidiomarina sp. Khilg15.8]
MEGLLGILIAPIIIFMIFVAPIWVILHYRSKSKMNSGLNENEASSLQALARQAERMQERVKTLEAILDAEHGNWRRNHGGE